MACAHPLTQYNKYLDKYIQIPCNRCLNCRVDKRNSWSDRANYAYKQFNFIGSFVTFTFDDYHLFDSTLTHSCHVTDPRFSPDDKSYVTLSKSDIKNLIARIRSYMDYHNINSPTVRRDFKYLAVGEYGSAENSTVGYGRPHYHVLFFGLDFHDAQFLFEKCWKGGIIDSRPILDGGINYVLKYLDKQLFDEQKFNTYDRYHIEAPFKTQSPNLGSDIYLDAILSGFAETHDNHYKVSPTISRPIPRYYQAKYLNYKKQGSSQFAPETLISSYNSAHNSSMQLTGTQFNFTKSLRVFNLMRAKLRELNLINYCRQKGVAVNDPLSYSHLSENGKYYILNSDLPKVPNNYSECQKLLKEALQ